MPLNNIIVLFLRKNVLPFITHLVSGNTLYLKPYKITLNITDKSPKYGNNK